MMTYDCRITVTSRIYIEVEADSTTRAKQQAVEQYLADDMAYLMDAHRELKVECSHEN